MDFKRVALNWFKGNDLMLWRLKNSQDETVAKVLDDETQDEAISILAMNLDSLPVGLYKLFGRKKKQDSNGEVVHNFYVPETMQQHTPSVQGDPFQSVVTKLEEQLKKAEAREKEYQDRERKRAEEERIKEVDEKWRKKFEKLEQEKEKPDLIDRIQGLLGQFNVGVNIPFNIGSKPKTAINGVPAEHQQATGESAQPGEQEPQNDPNAIIRKSLSQMRALFADDNSFLHFFHSVGNIAEHEPQKFQMLLNFMGQSQSS